MQRFPVADARPVVSTWGARRDGGTRSHEGADVFAPRGALVVAPIDGRIVYANQEETDVAGFAVQLVGEDGTFYVSHLDGAPMVRVGDSVRVGDALGRVGNSGNARRTAHHAHVQWRPTGASAWVDPAPVLQQLQEQEAMSTPDFDAANTAQLLGFTSRMLDSLDRIVNVEPIPEFAESPELRAQAREILDEERESFERIRFAAQHGDDDERAEELARNQSERLYRYTRGLRDRVDAMRATSFGATIGRPASLGLVALAALALFVLSERS